MEATEVKVLAGHSLAAATASTNLSWPTVLALYVLTPMVLVGLIAAVVLTFTKRTDRDTQGSAILGQPAGLPRHERDGQATLSDLPPADEVSANDPLRPGQTGGVTWDPPAAPDDPGDPP